MSYAHNPVPASAETTSASAPAAVLPMTDVVGIDSSFADYYGELTTLLGRVDALLSSSSGQIDPSGTNTTSELVTTALRLLDDEGTELLNSLEMETQTLPSRTRVELRPYLTHIRDSISHHRTTARSLQHDIDTATETNARVRLLSNANNNNPNNQYNDKAQRDLEAASNSIVDSRKHLMETETVGASILNDLQTQRATIVRARNNLGNVDDGLHVSSSIVSSMHRRAIVNKIIIYVIAVIIAIACVAVLYMRLFHPAARTHPRPTTTSTPPPPPVPKASPTSENITSSSGGGSDTSAGSASGSDDAVANNQSGRNHRRHGRDYSRGQTFRTSVVSGQRRGAATGSDSNAEPPSSMRRRQPVVARNRL